MWGGGGWVWGGVGVCVWRCVWMQIYYRMETCVHFTPPNGDMIPYDIIQCSIRKKKTKTKTKQNKTKQATACENAQT